MRSSFVVIVILLLGVAPSGQPMTGGIQPHPEGPSLVPGDAEPESPLVDPSTLLSSTGSLFIENLGQFGPGAGDYYARGDPLSVAFGPGWVAFHLLGPEGEQAPRGAMFRIRFEDARPVRAVGMDPFDHPTNFFLGDDPDDWVVGARSYRRLRYPDLWEGIDLEYYFMDGKLKYEFTVHPGASPSSIRLGYEGVEGLSIDRSSGDLLVHTAIGTIDDKAPMSFQGDDEDRHPVESHFELFGPTGSGFSVGPYDEALPLIIDPGLTFSTYIGGTGLDETYDMFVDEDRNIYLGGATRSGDFPTSVGAYNGSLGGSEDGFILKFDPNGTSLIYSTLLGGDSYDGINAIAVDFHGQAYLTGRTWGGFPVTPGAFQLDFGGGISDAFVTKLDANGSSLVYSTYLGGSGGSNGWDGGFGIQVDDEGFAYVTGMAVSTNFPTTDGAYDRDQNGLDDIFISKLEENGSSLVYSTYIGGDDRDVYSKDGNPIVLDANGSVTINGWTSSSNFPTTVGAYDRDPNGNEDVFVLKLRPDGSDLEHSTFIGGSAQDVPTDCQVGPEGNVYVTGYTRSADFPNTTNAPGPIHNGGQDVFVFKLNLTGAYLAYSTFLGGVGDELAHCIDVDPDGLAYITGSTSSFDFPTTSGSFDGDLNGTSDVFITVIDTNGTSVTRSTYLGGDGDESGWNIIADRNRDVYVSGTTTSLDFPITGGGLQTELKGSTDIFLLHLPLDIIYTTPPSAPLNLTVKAGDGMALLSWESPLDLGSLPLLGYHIYRGTNGSALERVSTIGAVTEFTDEGLVNGQEYLYKLVAFNERGIGPQSYVVSVTPLGPPSEPVSVMLTYGDTLIGVAWLPPERTGGSPLVGYRVLMGSSEGTLAEVGSVDGEGSSYVAAGLTNGQTYYFAIIAFNGVGNGPISAIVNGTPLGLPSVPSVFALEASDGQVILTWGQPLIDGGAPVLDYIIYRGTSEDALVPYDGTGGDTTSFTDTGLTNGQTLYYAVSALNKMGEGPRTTVLSATPFGAPGAPGSLVATPGDGEVSLDWEPPEDDGASPLTGHIVMRGTSPEDLRFLVQLPDATSYVDASVTNDVTYHYSVTAVNIAGPGDASDTVMATPFRPRTIPGQVPPLVAQAEGAEVTLLWGEPVNDGGSPLTGYVIYRGRSPDILERIAEVEPGTRSLVDGGLERGTVYYYNVAARNIIGQGPSSTVVSVEVSNRVAVSTSDPFPLLLIVIASLGAVGVGVGAVATTEWGRFKLALLGFPLFSRLKEDAVLDNKTRYALLGVVVAKPGIHFSALMQEFNISIGTAAYHLDVLERENFVRSVRDGRLKRFYPSHVKIPDNHMGTPEEIRESILTIVGERPGISQKEMIEELGIDRDIVGYYLRELVKEGKLEDAKVGRYMVYRLSG